MFVAFGKTVDAFEAQPNRMVGNEERVIDAIPYQRRYMNFLYTYGIANIGSYDIAISIRMTAAEFAMDPVAGEY